MKFASYSLAVLGIVFSAEPLAQARNEWFTGRIVASCVQGIRVRDTIPPTIVCLPDLTVQCLADVPPRPATLAEFFATGGTADDNSDTNLEFRCEETPLPGGGCGGNILRTFTVIDDSTNTASCVQRIRVWDTIPPRIVCLPDLTVQCLADVPPRPATLAEFVAAGGTADDNCDANLEFHCVENSLPGGGCGGNILRTFTVLDDCTNSASCVQRIRVWDTIPPRIVCLPDLTVQCLADVPPRPATLAEFVAAGGTADDNCDANLEFHCVENSLPGGGCGGNILRTFTVIDDCTNSASCVQRIQIRDTIPPLLVGVPADMTTTCDQVPAPGAVTATDNCDTSPSLTLTEVRTPGDWPTGPTLYTLVRTWTATDACTNRTTSVRRVTVVNSCPAALGQSVSTCEDTALAVSLTATHVDAACVSTPLVYYILRPPVHGTLRGTPPNVAYTPAPDYSGSDSFTFKLSDGLCESAEATISIAVLPVNDPPVCHMVIGPLLKVTPGETALFVLACDNQQAAVVLDGSLSSDIDSAVLSYVWLDNGLPSGTGAILTNALTVGTHEITLVVSDENTGTAPGCVSSGGTDSCSQTVTVITGCEAVEQVVVLLEQTTLDRKTKRPFIAGLKAACASFNRGNCISGCNQLESFQNKVRAQIARENPAAAELLITATQAILDAFRPCGCWTPR